MAKDLIAGKKIGRGHQIKRRGIAKCKGGIGLNIHNRADRSFRPNMINKRIFDEETGRWVRLKMSAASLRIVDKLGLKAALEYGKKKNK